MVTWQMMARLSRKIKRKGYLTADDIKDELGKDAEKKSVDAFIKALRMNGLTVRTRSQVKKKKRKNGTAEKRRADSYQPLKKKREPDYGKFICDEKENASLSDEQASDWKNIILEKAKKNGDAISQDDIMTMMSNLDVGDDGFASLLDFLQEKGVKVTDMDNLADDGYDEDDDEKVNKLQWEKDLSNLYREPRKTGKKDSFSLEQAEYFNKSNYDSIDEINNFTRFAGTNKWYIYQGTDAIKLYIYEAYKYPLLNKTGEQALAKLVKKGGLEGERAKEEFTLCNLKLVIYFAKRYYGKGIDFLDLVQEGNQGLSEAVERYNPKVGPRFATYAKYWIKQAIIRALDGKARAIHISNYTIRQFFNIMRTSRKLTQKLNHDPTPEEISYEMGGALTAEQIQDIQIIAMDPVSLDEPLADGAYIGDYIVDKVNESPVKHANATLLRDKLDEVLKDLTKREEKVIRLRYGLDDGIEHTLEYVGRKFGVTRERIRQIEAKAIKKLRHPARSKQLKDNLDNSDI